MSQFLPETEQKQQAETKAGPEAYLSADERKALQRSLSFPEDLPPRFKSWLIDFIAVNIPQIPVSQIVGFKQVEQVEVTTANVATSGTTTSGTYTDLASAGPEITGLRDGQYLIFFGCRYMWNSAAQVTYMSLSVNGSAASDADACTTVAAGASSVVSAVTKTLSNGNANTLTAKYRTDAGTTGSYIERWLIAQRIGPVSS